MAVVVEPGVGLGDDVLLLLVGREVLDIVCDDRLDREGVGLLLLELGDRLGGERLALLENDAATLGDQVGACLVAGQRLIIPGHRALDLAVRGLDEAVAIDPAVRRERADEADVRPLRGLDRAHPPVVGRVHVADLDRGALARQSTGAEGGQPSAVPEAREAVRLVHELAEL